MFSPIPMLRLRLLALTQNEHEILRVLGQDRAVQLTRSPCGPDTAPLSPPDRAGELARCNRILTRIENIRRSTGTCAVSHTTPDPALTLDKVEEILDRMEEKVEDPAEMRRQLCRRRDHLAGQRAKTAPYRGLGIPLSSDHPSPFVHFVTGSLPVENLNSLESRYGEGTVFLPLDRQKGRQWLVAATSPHNRIPLERALQEAGFHGELFFGSPSVSVDDLWRDGEEELQRIEGEIKSIDRQMEGFAREFARVLKEIELFIGMECRIIEADQKFPRTEATVLIGGWIPTYARAEVEEHLEEITGGRYILETTRPGAGEEDVPILLRHSRVLRPFETLVSTYGLPGYRELEPTLFVAVSYVIMFGVMFGDAGHGLILALCGLIAMTRTSRKARDLGMLLLLAGLSSIFFGVIFGSYFGMEFCKRYALWHDPLEGDPIQLMYAAMGFGVGLISLGIVLNVINRFRRADLTGAFLDRFGLAGLLFYWGALVILVNPGFFTARAAMGPALAVFIAAPLVAWMVREPLQRLLHEQKGSDERTSSDGMGTAIAESFVGAFEGLLSYLANTISFVRLAAYAMSHAALLVAAFMLADQVRHFPVGGALWSVVVIVLGNVVALILEGIIASVQALRLEYYEFFGKFFSGKGQPFEPFSLIADDQPSA